MSSSDWLVVIFALLGFVARVFVPWLIKRVKSPDAPDSKWNWRYVGPQLVTIVILLLVAPIVSEDIASILDNTPLEAYLIAWGAADVGKTIFIDTGATRV